MIQYPKVIFQAPKVTCSVGNDLKTYVSTDLCVTCHIQLENGQTHIDKCIHIHMCNVNPNRGSGGYILVKEANCTWKLISLVECNCENGPCHTPPLSCFALWDLTILCWGTLKIELLHIYDKTHRHRKLFLTWGGGLHHACLEQLSWGRGLMLRVLDAIWCNIWANFRKT